MKTIPQVWNAFWRWVCALFLMVALPLVGVAQEEIDEEEPLPAEEAPEGEPADPPRWSLRPSVTYMRGDYGTDVTTEFIYAPVRLQRHFSRGRMSVTVPYLWIERSEDVVVFDGVPEVRGDGEAVEGNEVEGEEERTATETSEGLGDVVVGGEFYLFKAGKVARWFPGVGLTGDVKFPTADEEEGLGTGEYDASLGVGVHQWLGRQWMVFGNWRYRFIGQPEDDEFKNQEVYGGGLSYRPSENWRHSTFVENRTAVTESREDATTGYYSLTRNFTQSFQTTGSVGVGLTESAADYSFTLGLGVRF